MNMSQDNDDSVFVQLRDKGSFRGPRPVAAVPVPADDDASRMVMPGRKAPGVVQPAAPVAAAEDDDASRMVMPGRKAPGVVLPAAPVAAAEDDDASRMVMPAHKLTSIAPDGGDEGGLGAVSVSDSGSVASAENLHNHVVGEFTNEPLREGELLNRGVYQIKSVMGQGGFGITYLAYDTNLKVDVVIKENFPANLALRHSRDQSVVSRQQGDAQDPYLWTLEIFSKEAQTIAAAGARKMHPNIVNVLNFFPERGTAYYVMRYVHGKSLLKSIETDQWDEASLKSMLLCMLSGLKYLHENGILHLDIKPANILLQEDGNPVLIDFGASMTGSGGDGTVVYSKGYAPPEQYSYESADMIGAWSDMYALGATMYHVITGRKPAEDSLPLLARHSEFPGYSRAFLAGIDKAMHPEISQRWQSAREWLGLFDRMRMLDEEAREEQLRRHRERQAEAYQKNLEAQKKQHEQDIRRQQAANEASLRKQIEELKRQHAQDQEKTVKRFKAMMQNSSGNRSAVYSPHDKWTLFKAYKSGLKRFFKFSGRASRAEFLYICLSNFIAWLGGLIAYVTLGSQNENIFVLMLLLCIIPVFSASVRRLHDIGLCAWWWLLTCIPLVGWILLLWKTKPGANKFGDGPLPPA